MVGWYHQLNGHEFEQTLGKDREAWCAAIPGLTNSQTLLSNWTTNHISDVTSQGKSYLWGEVWLDGDRRAFITLVMLCFFISVSVTQMCLTCENSPYLWTILDLRYIVFHYWKKKFTCLLLPQNVIWTPNFFSPMLSTCGILVPWLGVRSSHGTETLSPKHWTSKEFPRSSSFQYILSDSWRHSAHSHTHTLSLSLSLSLSLTHTHTHTNTHRSALWHTYVPIKENTQWQLLTHTYVHTCVHTHMHAHPWSTCRYNPPMHTGFSPVPTFTLSPASAAKPFSHRNSVLSSFFVPCWACLFVWYMNKYLSVYCLPIEVCWVKKPWLLEISTLAMTAVDFTQKLCVTTF